MFLYFWQYLNLADRKGVSRELALHPVHLTPDKDGNLPPSAFVPFCSYQGNNNLRGQERSELENLSMCDEFEPIILEGQLCFSLALRKSRGKVAKSGKTNGLLLLLDPSPYQLNTTDRKARGSRTEEQSFKVFIHTLEPHTIFGPGSYGMSTLKRITVTKSFEQLPDYQKKCYVHNREECQTRKYLDQVQRECKCIPWLLQADRGKNKVKQCFCLFLSGRISLSAVQRKRTVLRNKLWKTAVVWFPVLVSMRISLMTPWSKLHRLW